MRRRARRRRRRVRRRVRRCETAGGRAAAAAGGRRAEVRPRARRAHLEPLAAGLALARLVGRLGGGRLAALGLLDLRARAGVIRALAGGGGHGAGAENAGAHLHLLGVLLVRHSARGLAWAPLQPLTGVNGADRTSVRLSPSSCSSTPFRDLAVRRGAASVVGRKRPCADRAHVESTRSGQRHRALRRSEHLLVRPRVS